MRFATYNVLHGRRGQGAVDIDGFGAAVASLDSHVVGLQEVDQMMLRTRRVDMTAIAAERSDAFGFFGSARRRWDLGSFGNALLVRAPKAQAFSAVALPRTNWRRERRCAVVADVSLAGVEWKVATTHLSLFAEESARQLEFLLKRLSERPSPRVLMGDFNRKFEEVENIAHAHGWDVVETGPTYPAWGPEQRIDFILTSGAHAVHSEVRSLEISDHCAVIADLVPA